MMERGPTRPAAHEQAEEEFARGQAHAGEERDVGRFSTGQMVDETPLKSEEGRFSTGQEVAGATPEKEHEGRFSERQEVFRDDPEREDVGGLTADEGDSTEPERRQRRDN